MPLRFLVFAGLLVAAPCSHASISGYFSMGLGGGGTNLSDLTGGQDYKIRAGSGLFLSGGLVLPISPTVPHRFEGQFGFGYFFQGGSRNNDNEVFWSRLPLEALYYYRNTREQFRLGWGLTYHVNGELSAKGANASAETKVDNALGWIITAEKLWPSNNQRWSWSLGIRYLNIEYNLSRFSKKADGNAWLLTVSAFSF